jgi:hypothetical protein
MVGQSFHRLPLGLSLWMAISAISLPGRAEDCTCDSVVISDLSVASTEYGSDPGGPDVLIVAGRRFPIIGGIYPDASQDEDLSLKVQEGTPFSLYIGPGRAFPHHVSLSFSCGVEEVEVNGVPIPVTEAVNSNVCYENPEAISITRKNCGLTLSIYLFNVGGKSYTISARKHPDSTPCPDDSHSPPPSENPGPGEASHTFGGSFPSGLASGVSNGIITWSAPSAADGVSLDSLRLPGVAPDPADHFFIQGTEYENDGNRLQYKTDTQLFDAVSSNDTLTLKFYQTSDPGVKTGDFYNPSNPDLTVIYERTGDAILVSRALEAGQASAIRLLEWQSNPQSASWTDFLHSRKSVTIRTMSGNNPVVTSETWSAENSPQHFLTSRVAREFEPDGQGAYRVVSVTRHADTAGTDLRVQTLVYGADGEVERRYSNDGSWSIRTSGGDARFGLQTGDTSLEVTYTPWLDAAYPSSGLPAPEHCVARVERKRVVGNATLEITETHTAGALTGRTERERVATGASGYREETTRQFTESGQYLETATFTHPASDPDHPGKIFRRIDPAGATTTYTYANFVWVEPSGNSPGGFSENTEGTFRGTYITEGSAASPDGILDSEGNTLTTRTLVIRDPSGRELRRETQAYLGGGSYETMTYTSYEYDLDLNGRVLSTTTIRDGRTVAIEERPAPGVARFTGEDGVWETVTTDPFGRVQSVASPGLTVTHSHSSLSTTITASTTGLPGRVTSSTANLSGETTSTTDEATPSPITRATTPREPIPPPAMA